MLSAGAQLAEWIEKRGYDKRAEAAKSLRISEGFLSMLLNGLRLPGRDKAVQIQELTGIPVSAWTVKSKSQSKKPRARRQPQVSDSQGVM